MRQGGFKRVWHNNALSIVLFGLFALCIGGQSLAGWLQHSEQQAQHGQLALPYGRYLTSGEFLEATFENWESEFLQMAAFVFLAAFLKQRGSSESKPPEGDEEHDADPRQKKQPDSPGPVHRGGLALSLYSRSLSLALVGLFVFSFAMHAVGGLRALNEEKEAHGEAAVGLFSYVSSSTFWFESFQNWQSEFMSVGALVVLSIFLRQKGSPESKPVQAPHSQTG